MIKLICWKLVRKRNLYIRLFIFVNSLFFISELVYACYNCVTLHFGKFNSIIIFIVNSWVHCFLNNNSYNCGNYSTYKYILNIKNDTDRDQGELTLKKM